MVSFSGNVDAAFDKMTSVLAPRVCICIHTYSMQSETAGEVLVQYEPFSVWGKQTNGAHDYLCLFHDHFCRKLSPWTILMLGLVQFWPWTWLCIIMKSCRGVMEQPNHHVRLSHFQLCIVLSHPHYSAFHQTGERILLRDSLSVSSYQKLWHQTCDFLFMWLIKTGLPRGNVPKHHLCGN